MSDLKAWQTSPLQWCVANGAHVPHIGEISPAQYGSLSARAKKAYDAKRAREWEASGATKAEWERRVLAAYAAGEPDDTASQAARDAYAAAVRRGTKAREAGAAQARRAANELEISDCKVGERVFSFCTQYATVTRVNRVSVSVVTETGRKMVIRAGAVMRVAPHELA